MNHTISHEIQTLGQGSSQVIIREDSYINATALCKAAVQSCWEITWSLFC